MERINFNKCSPQNFAVFINNLGSKREFRLTAHYPADKNIMQDRYTYLVKGIRVSIVYETKAQALIITAPAEVITELKASLPNEISGSKQEKDRHSDNKQEANQGELTKFRRPQGTFPPKQESRSGDDMKKKAEPTYIQNSAPTKRDNGSSQTADKPDMPQGKQDKGQNRQEKGDRAQKKNAQSNKPAISEKIAVRQHETPVQQNNSTEKAQQKQGKINVSDKPTLNKEGENHKNSVSGANDENPDSGVKMPRPVKSRNEGSKRQNRTPKTDVKASNDSGQKQKKKNAELVNAFSIKKITPERFEELLKKIKANKSMRYKLISSENGIRRYNVTSQNQKAVVHYEKDNLQLGGEMGDLYRELQLMISQVSDYKTAINSHIKSTGEEKRPKDVDRQLKRKLPSAYEFLSEQSKIDLAIGILDINNPAVVLSDYSTLLIPCFRGLERLIFDLQHAQGIVVKMIGQAYEKKDGNYVLKSGYRRRIPSVIYAEVMASLYAEYFKQRNFYAHSDGGYDNLSRVISDKQQVQNIFNHILEVIDYNGKKLKEIGFSIA